MSTKHPAISDRMPVFPMYKLDGYSVPFDRKRAVLPPAKPETSSLTRTLFVWIATLIIGSTTGGIFGARFIPPLIADMERESGQVDGNDHSVQSIGESEVQVIERDIDQLRSIVTTIWADDRTANLSRSRHVEALNNMLIDAQRRSLESRAVFVSLQSVIANGGDLKPFRQRLQPTDEPGDNVSLLEIAKQSLTRSGKEEDSLRALIESVRDDSAGRERLSGQIESVRSQMRSLNAAISKTAQSAVEPEGKASPVLIVRSLSPSEIRIEFVAPKQMVSIVLGALVGAVASTVFVGSIRWLYGRPGSADELNPGQQPPLLAEVPVIEQPSGKGLDSVLMYVRPDGLDSKPFRNLRSAITFSSGSTQRLLVTSPDLGDGKSTVAVNLALSFAQSKRNTLLIDADIRRAGTTQILDLLGRRGLTQILHDTKAVTESCLENVFNMGIDNLDVLPAGLLSEDPAELLNGNRFHLIIAWAKASYDQILIDGPALSQVQDLQALSRLTDCAVVVVRSDKNRRKLLKRAIESCQVVGVQILGVVANRLTGNRTFSTTLTNGSPSTDVESTRDKSDASRRAAV